MIDLLENEKCLHTNQRIESCYVDPFLVSLWKTIIGQTDPIHKYIQQPFLTFIITIPMLPSELLDSNICFLPILMIEWVFI